MTSADIAEALLASLGEDLGLEDLAFDEQGRILLTIDEQQLVTLALDAEDPDALYLFSAIVPVSPETPGLLWRALKANYLWEGTAGATLAVEPEAGVLVAHRRLALPGLTYPDFHQAVRLFAELTAVWGEAGNRAAGDDTPGDDTAGGDTAGGDTAGDDAEQAPGDAAAELTRNFNHLA